MTFEGLERFVQLVRCSNYSLAADELYISQSTLSRQIMSIEQELGCKLIAHVGRKISLTESGMFFYDYACHALKQYAEIRTKISEIEMNAPERIRIGYTTEGHRKLLRTVLVGNFDDYHTYIFSKDNTEKLIENLMNGNKDCFICHRIVVDSLKEQINVRKIETGRLVLCVSERNQLSKLDVIKATELTKLNAMVRISFVRSLTAEGYDFFNAFLERYHVCPAKTIEMDDFESYLLNVEMTNGFCMGSALEPKYQGYHDILIDEDVPEMDLVFVSRKEEEGTRLYQLERLYYLLLSATNKT